MTVCNMSIEGGARAGLIAPDDTTFEYLHGRPARPGRAGLGRRGRRAGARCRPTTARPTTRSITIDADALEPMVTYGTNPGMGIPITSRVPSPADQADPGQRRALERALEYMDLQPGQAILGQKVDVVFVGSCTNGRISDLRLAAERAQGPPRRGRRAADGRARLGRGEARGRGRGPVRDLQGGRRRVARGGLLDVHRDERRPAPARPVRGQHQQPQLRGPPGQGRPDVPGLAADRRRQRDRRRRRRPATPARASRRWPPSGVADRVAEPFTVFTSRVVPLPAENVDTDQIVPARYLKVTDKDGLAEALFRDWRFEEDGSLKEPPLRPRPARRWPGRKILLVGDNFGAGLVARARPVGADRVGHPGDPVDLVRRHLPQQQPQERRAADRRRRRRPTRGCSSSWPTTRTPS